MHAAARSSHTSLALCQLLKCGTAPSVPVQVTPASVRVRKNPAAKKKK